MDITKFFSLKYLFMPAPGTMQEMIYPLGVAFLLLLLCAIAIQAYVTFRSSDPYIKRYLRKAPSKLYLFGILGLLLLWFRYERAPYLSMRIWLLLLCMGCMVWILYYCYHVTDIERNRLADAHREHLKRYQQ